jgi:hypothetical protein
MDELPFIYGDTVDPLSDHPLAFADHGEHLPRITGIELNSFHLSMTHRIPTFHDSPGTLGVISGFEK